MGMKRYKPLLFIYITLALFQFNAMAQTCIQGNCKDGFSVLRNDKTYLLGNFKSGKLEGEGMQVIFHTTKFIERSREGDFLVLAAFGLPSLEEVLKLRPQIVKHGVFTNGELNGKGTLYATDENGLPEFRWLIRFAERWVGAWGWKQIRYDGEFSKTNASGRGQIILELQKGKIKCTGDSLARPTLPDVILEIEGEGFAEKGLFRGSFLDGYPHGFALTNVINRQLTKDKKLVRQAWLHGVPNNTITNSNYPADEGGTGIHQLPDGIVYTGPVDDKGKALGFGKMEKRNTTYGTLEWKYTGYFHEGKRTGEGFMELYSWKIVHSGTFSRDTLIAGTTTVNNYNFKQTSASAYLKSGWPDKGTAYIAEWPSLDAYREGKDPDYSYWGDIAAGGAYNGYGTYTAKGIKKEGYWTSGTLTQGSGTVEYNSLNGYYIIVYQGLASGIYLDKGSWKTMDGRLLPYGAKFQLSKLPRSRFISNCYRCNGSGKETEVHHVAAATISNSFTTNTSKSVDYLNSYWATTTKTTLSFTRPGYSYTTSKTCTFCYGAKQDMMKIAIPEP